MNRLPLFLAQVCVCMLSVCCVCPTGISPLSPLADISYCDEKGSIRLTQSGSENSSTGVVQICHYGVWIPICGQGWHEFEASLACQELGFIGEWLLFLVQLMLVEFSWFTCATNDMQGPWSAP